MADIFVHHENGTVERINKAEAYARACKAISARLNGVFDAPELVAFGPLSDNTESDLLEILEFYGVG